MVDDGNSTGVPQGAEAPKPTAATLNIKDAQGRLSKDDLRVRIRVPVGYLQQSTVGLGNELAALKGIVFPYTPMITYDVKADYGSVNPMHGNYTQYFYKNSSIGAINITGKFTVQNEKDAGVYLATIHLLKALTKMRFGSDHDAGAPPPVCRLSAYGFPMNNVPIVIASFRVDMPDSVDYFTLGKTNPNVEYGQASVPMSSTIALSCFPMYSRKELQDFSVTGWLNNQSDFRSKGYL
jgi:hypothetical protein